MQEEGPAVGALGCATSYRREANGSCRAGDGLGSTSERGAPVLDVEWSPSSPVQGASGLSG